jgi:hypothetical protein
MQYAPFFLDLILYPFISPSCGQSNFSSISTTIFSNVQGISDVFYKIFNNLNNDNSNVEFH